MTTARTYWIDASDLEKGLDTFVYRKKPEEPGNWTMVEVAYMADLPQSGGEPVVRNHLAEHIKGMY
jgi:hypothetical protein